MAFSSTVIYPQNMIEEDLFSASRRMSAVKEGGNDDFPFPFFPFFFLSFLHSL